MSAEEIKQQNFCAALDAVVQDYTCVYCSKFLEDPVTLSACFHLICSSHFESLTHCPACNTSLANSTTIDTDRDRLQATVNAVAELSKAFKSITRKPMVSKQNTGSKKSGNNFPEPSTAHRVSNKENKLEKTNSSLKATKSAQKGGNVPEPTARRDNKENKLQKTNFSSKASTSAPKATTSDLKIPAKAQKELNSTLRSSTSSDIIKGNEKRNNKGETPLHVACRLGKIESVEKLLNQGANTNTKDNAGWTPLHEVVQNGRLDILKLLLPHNTLIDVPGPGNETPLHEAVRYKHKDIAVELVRNGANINARNCKSQTPLELASLEMKEILKRAEEDIIHTQGLNISYISDLHSELDFDNIHTYCASSSNSLLTKLKLLAKHHSNLHVEVKLTKKVTHLIVNTDENYVCKSSVDVLEGIVSCIWIVSTDWINKSTPEKLEHYKDYEVVGVGTKTYNGPRNARYNKYKQLPGIFNGCHFYLHNYNVPHKVSPTVILTKTILTKLITEAGGVVLRRVPNPEQIPEAEQLVPYHAKEGGKLIYCSHYIIFKEMYEPMYNMAHIKALPIGWLIECIEKYELCEPW